MYFLCTIYSLTIKSRNCKPSFLIQRCTSVDFIPQIWKLSIYSIDNSKTSKKQTVFD